MKKLFTLLLSLFALVSHANQPIEIIVSQAPGGVTDTVARAMQHHLTTSLGLESYLNNKPGADGRIAGKYAVGKPADGTSLMIVGTGPFVFNKVLYNNLGYDYTDFDMLPLVRTQLAVIVPGDSKINTLQEFVTYSATHNMNCGVTTSPSSFLAKYLKAKLSLTTVEIIPYNRGGFSMLPDLISGNLNCLVDAANTYKAQHLAKKVKIIALSSSEQVPDIGKVSLISEMIPGFSLSTWIGIGILKNTPDAIKQQILNSAKAMRTDKEFINTMDTTGMEVMAPIPNPEEFVSNEIKKVTEMARILNISKVD